MEKNTILVKVKVSERLPEDGEAHIFHLIKPIPSVDEGEKKFETCYCNHPEQIEYVKKNCDWWLEDISDNVEERTEYNSELISAFIDHCNEEHGIKISEKAFMSFFNA